MSIKFTDGIGINVDGPYKIIEIKDGLYVVGGGILCPVASEDEGAAFIDRLRALDEEEAAD